MRRNRKGEPAHVKRELGKEEAKELRRLENERDKIQDRLAAVLKPLKKAEIRAFKGIWSCKLSQLDLN
jgi:hypothetical protein